MKITIKQLGQYPWREGTIEGHHFQAAVYDEPSVYGINEGRISKLMVPSVFFALTLTDTHWMMKPLPSPKRGSMKWSVKSETQTPSQCILCKEQFPLARLYSRPMEKPCG